jgi:prephenate dehydrogenase
MNVLVVGAGEMGRWLASHFEDVAVADRDTNVARGAADALDARTADDGERFDVVAFAVPMDAIDAAAAAHADRARDAVVDVTGEMERAVAVLRDHAPDSERLSLHPLFAADSAPGNVAAVPDAPGPATDAVRERLAAAGNEIFETTVAEHDRAMETVQARAHTAVLAYALAAEDVREEFYTPLSGPLADLVDQMLGNEPRVYADVQEKFEGAEDVARAASRIADADHEAFVDLYEAASRRTDGRPADGDDPA